MISALKNGRIGINVFERAISNESNNVSNVTTVAHKQDVVRFEDLLYSNDGYGKGVAIQSTSKSFSQGPLQKTDVKLDVAIQGKGFFIVGDRGSNKIYYTRAGNFQQGEDGFLETQVKDKVLGLRPQKLDIISTVEGQTRFTNDYSKSITSFNISYNDVAYNYNVKATDFYNSAKDDETSGDNSKTATSKIRDVEQLKDDFLTKLKLFKSNPNVKSEASQTQITKIDFAPQLDNLKDKNDYLHVTIDNIEYSQNFDTDVETTLRKLSDKISNSKGLTSKVDVEKGSLTVESLVPGDEFFVLESNANNDYVLKTELQKVNRGSGLAMIESSRQSLKKAVENADAKYLEITSVLDFSDKNVIGKEDINLRLNALGLVENIKGEVTIEEDGLVYVRDEENTFLVSKISTAFFRNEHGLDPLGSNIYGKTNEAGKEQNGDVFNTLIPQVVERGNVGYADTLTKMLFFQKAFEANSKSITVSDEFLKTAIDMKK